MTVRLLWERQWARRAIAIVFILVVLAPVFAWAAGQVGYTEPLEVAAEETGAADDTAPTLSGPLADYSVPGLSSPVGTFLSGLVGSALVLVLAFGLGRLVGGDPAEQ